VAYEDFIAKIKKETSSHLSLKELVDYAEGKQEATLYFVIHGSAALVRIDVKLIGLEPILEGAELRDAELQCTLQDGRFFKINASSITPPRLPQLNEPPNHSRVFTSKEARDQYFDGLAYVFEVEEEHWMADAKHRQERFLSWFVRRMGGPEKEH